MDNSRNISGNTFGDYATVIQGDVHNSFNDASSDADSSFLQEISKTDPVHDKKRILELKGPFLHESFYWILDHEDFNSWRHTKQSGVFWIKGDPGKGKTMLLCGLIEEFENDPKMNTNLAYFFCQATDSRINTALAVVGGLILSLFRRHRQLLSRIRQKYENGPKGQFNGPNAWFILSDIFETITQDPALTDTVCVVDALDECNSDCTSLLSLIVKTSSHVKWLLSSRNVKDIERKLQSIESPRRLSLELKENAEYVSKSVDLYIESRVQNLDALEDDEDLRTKTLNVLKSRAKGTFLWVALVIEQLRDTDHRNVEDVLEDMPEGLESLYDLIMSRANERLREKDRDACRVLLSIVTVAERPLRLEELLVFIRSQWEHFRTSYGLNDTRDMVKDCGSFLSMRDDTVYFVHQSAKDYMIKNAASSILPSGMEHQHYQMFKTSLQAMSSVLKYDIYNLKAPGAHIDSISPPSPDPLAPTAYCCIFWVEHLVRSCASKRPTYQGCLKDNGILHSFLKEKYLCWLESLVLLHSPMSQAVIAIQKLQSLIASYCGSKGKGLDIGTIKKLRRERETLHLRKLNDDAYRFLLYSKDFVCYWPLQLYFSAIAFEDDNSIIHRSFQPTIRADLGASPIVTSMPQNQCSLLQTLVPPTWINTLLFSPDSALIGSLCHFGSVALWRTDTGHLERIIDVDLESRVAFLPDLNHMVSVSRKGIVKIWGIDNGVCAQERSLNLGEETYLYLHPVSPQILCEGSLEEVIALSPNGDLVASVHRMSPGKTKMVKLWDTKTGDCHCTIDQSGMPVLPYAAFSPNSELIALAYRNGIGVYSIKTGQVVQHLDYHWQDERYLWCASGPGLTFSPNSKFLAALEYPLQVCLWNTGTWKRLHRVEEATKDPSIKTHFSISPDSAILASCTYEGFTLWSMDTGKCVAKVTGDVKSVSFSPDWTKSLLIASQNGNMVQIWSADITHTIPKTKNLDPSWESVVISPDSRFVVLSHPGRTEIKVWSGDKGRCIRVLKKKCPWHFHRNSIIPTFSPDSKLLASHEGWQSDEIRIWHVTTGRPACLLRGRGSLVSSMAFSSDSKSLVSVYRDGTMRIWGVRSGKCLHECDSGNKGNHTSVAFSLDSKYIASGSTSGTVRIWSLVAGRYVLNLELRDHKFGVTKLTFSSDSAILVSFAGKEALIWRVTTGTCLGCVDIGQNVHSASFDPIKDQILTDRFAFRTTSSWEHYEKIPRMGYSFFHGDDRNEAWICLNGEKFFWIAREFRPQYRLDSLDMSDSLLAFLNASGKLILIKLPTPHKAQQEAVRVLDCQDASASNLSVDGSLTSGHRSDIAGGEMGSICTVS